MIAIAECVVNTVYIIVQTLRMSALESKVVTIVYYDVSLGMVELYAVLRFPVFYETVVCPSPGER